LCDIISKHSDKIKSIQVEPIIRSGLRRFSDQVGKLWTTMADYYIRMDNIDKARDVFEEGMNSVITIVDFTQIWDAYATFEEKLVDVDMNNESAEITEEEITMQVTRFEHLVERQGLLINSVLLRQNPHQVQEWIKRAQLYDGNPNMVVHTYQQAIKTVDPQKAKGKPHTIWISFAKYYEDGGDVEGAKKF